jgi:GIY-YIG catalytic domain
LAFGKLALWDFDCIEMIMLLKLGFGNLALGFVHWLWLLENWLFGTLTVLKSDPTDSKNSTEDGEVSNDGEQIESESEERYAASLQGSLLNSPLHLPSLSPPPFYLTSSGSFCYHFEKSLDSPCFSSSKHPFSLPFYSPIIHLFYLQFSSVLSTNFHLLHLLTTFASRSVLINANHSGHSYITSNILQYTIPTYYSNFFLFVLSDLYKSLLFSTSTSKSIFSLLMFSDLAVHQSLSSSKPCHKTQKHLITSLMYLKNLFSEFTTLNSFLYIIFSPFSHHCYVGQTCNITQRILSHLSTAKRSYHSKCKLYKKFNATSLHRFAFYYIPIPCNFRLHFESILIKHFRPSLNTQTSPPTPLAFDPLTKLLSTISKFNFLPSLFLKKKIKPTCKSTPVQFSPSTFLKKPHLFHHKNTSATNLLALIQTSDSPSLPYKPIFIKISYGLSDCSDWNTLKLIFNSSSILTFSPSLQVLTIHDLHNFIQLQLISSFLLLPKGTITNSLNHPFVIEKILPKIAKGSLKPSSILKHVHLLHIFNLYSACQLMTQKHLISSSRQKISDYCQKTST